MVKQVSFIVGARLLNEQDLLQNLDFFKVPQGDIETIRSKLSMKIFERIHTNIRKKHVFTLRILRGSVARHQQEVKYLRRCGLRQSAHTTVYGYEDDCSDVSSW